MLADVHRAFVARRRGTRLLLLSDFDGTLAEFDLDPILPRTRSDAFAALVALSSLSHVTLGPVSGRRVADLIRRVPLGSEVYMAGLVEAADVAARPWMEGRMLRRLCGIDVREHLPAAAWTTRDAVRWIAHDVQRRTGEPPWIACYGDGLTDEDTFHAVDDGIPIVVGRRASSARVRLESPEEVAVALADLAEAVAAEVHR